MPKISVIIPVFNAEKYLVECLNSLINQTLEDWEALCVNDGSTDKSANILTKFSEKNPRIKIIYQENAGVSAARNKALQTATGEYFTFLDSDDVFDPHFLEMMLSAVTKDQTSVAGCSFRIFKNVFQPNPSRNSTCAKCYHHPFFRYLFRLLPYHVMIGGSFCHRSVFKDLKFDPQISHGEDTLLFYQILARVKAVSYVPAPLYGYRLSQDSLTRKHFSFKMTEDHILSFLKLQTFIQGETMPSFLRRLAQKRLTDRCFRWVCLKPFKKSKNDFLSFWEKYLPVINDLIQQNKFNPRDLKLNYRFLFWLWRQRHWKLLAFFLSPGRSFSAPKSHSAHNL